MLFPASCDTNVRNGACTAVCDANVDCDSTGFCAEITGVGKLCKVRCQDDVVCRTPDGFACVGVAVGGRRFCDPAPPARDGGGSDGG